MLLDVQAGGIVPRLSDFGLVKNDDPILRTVQGSQLGTPGYAAPEQLRDATTADARADLWSLGVLLVELIDGRAPSSHDASLADRLARLPPGPREIAADLLRPEPAARPASAGVVVVRLEALLPPEPDPLGPQGALAARLATLAPRPPVPSNPTWIPSEPGGAGPPGLTLGDFLTRHADSSDRGSTNRLHSGRLLLALLAAVGALALGARCAG